jgi:TRAP-type mannitol/chloroaromatic compound transport system permease small subunit
MKGLTYYIDSISIWSAKIFRWAVLILTIVVLYEVLARYIFNSPTIWAFDTAMMFYSMVFLFGGAFVLYEKKHIRVDVLFNLLSTRTRAIIDVVFYLVFFFPFVVAVIWQGGESAYISWLAREISNTSQWGEPIYPLKFMIPLGFFLLFLQGISELILTIKSIRGRRDDT